MYRTPPCFRSTRQRVSQVAILACICLASVCAGAGSLQTLTARPELPEGRRSPLCILLPGGPGRMPEATGAMTKLGNHLAERGWIVVVPVSPDGASFFGDATALVVSVMDRFEKDPGVRPGRILLAGISNGGIAALQVAGMAPGRVSGVIAIPGSLYGEVNVRNLQHLPVYVRIGADDPLGWAELYPDMVRTLKHAGARLDARLLDGVGHGIPIDWEEIDAWIAKELGALAPAPPRERRIALPSRAARFRRWTSRSGATVEAAVAEIHELHVVLVRQDGKTRKILRSHLSAADQEFLDSLIGAADRNPNDSDPRMMK